MSEFFRVDSEWKVAFPRLLLQQPSDPLSCNTEYGTLIALVLACTHLAMVACIITGTGFGLVIMH